MIVSKSDCENQSLLGPRDSHSERECYICRSGSNEDIIASDREGRIAVWVSPCRCAGSLAWVHQRCVMTCVQEMERSHPAAPPHCPTCRTLFTMDQPQPTTLETILALYVSLMLVKVDTTDLNYVYLICREYLFLCALPYWCFLSFFYYTLPSEDKHRVSDFCLFFMFLLGNLVPWEIEVMKCLQKIPLVNMAVSTPIQLDGAYLLSMRGLLIFGFVANMSVIVFRNIMNYSWATVLVAEILLIALKGLIVMMYERKRLIRTNGPRRVMPFERL